MTIVKGGKVAEEYTDEKAQDAVGTILTDSDSIDFTYDDNTPKIIADVKFKDSTGNYYTIFEGGAQSDNITYTLPIALPSNDKFLRCDNLGVWSWVEGTGAGVYDHDDLNNLNWALAGHTFDTDLDIGPYSQVFTEISTPANPPANDLKVYAKDVAGVTKLHTLDSAGNETELGAGDGGAGSLPELTDVNDALEYTNHYIFQADGSQYTGDTYSHTWLDDIGSYAHADIDTHITSTNNPHSVTAAQASAVALTGNESIDGIKTFTSFPILPTANPTTDYQASHKSYVDSVAKGLELKAAVRVATTENITLSGEQTIDGVSVVAGNRVLVKEQTDQTKNGIYIASSSAWSRAEDYDESDEVQEGTFCNILEGTENNNKQFAQITKDPVLETDPLVFTQLSAPIVYTASGEGIEVSANEFDLELDGTSLTKSASGLKVTAPVTTSYGGTGLTSIGSSNEVLGVNNAADALEYKSFTAGANITITHTEGDIEIASSLSGAPDFTYADYTIHSHPSSSFTWTNLPAALTAGSSYMKIKADLTGAVKYRMVVNQATAGYAGSKFRLRYSLNDSVYFDIGAEGNSGDLDIGTGTGVKYGAWEDIDSEAKQDIWLLIYGYGGDGIADPAWRQIMIQIKYNSSIVNGSASDKVYKEITIHAAATTNATWTNMPAALTQFLGDTYNRRKVDLSNCTHYRLVVNQSVAGYAGADINVRYSLTGTGAITTWLPLDTGNAGELDIGTGTIIKYGAWAPIVDAAKGDVWLGIVGKEGDGVADPAFRWVAIQFKEYTFGQGVAGNDTEVLFNDEGSTGTDSAFTYNKTTDTLTVPNLYSNAMTGTGVTGTSVEIAPLNGTNYRDEFLQLDCNAGAYLYAGSAKSETGLSGLDIELAPGAGDGAGEPGKIRLLNQNTDCNAFLNINNIDTLDKTFTFPNASGTFALIIDNNLTVPSISLNPSGECKIYDEGGNYVALTAPSLSASFTYAMPSDYGEAGQFLQTNGAGELSWVAGGGEAHNLLSATHSDTTASTVVRGDLVVGTGATPTWDNLALGTTGKFLKSDGTDAVWAEHGLTYADIKRTSVVLYMDCLALDTVGILLPRNWRDETVTSFAAQPDVPRQVTITVTPLFAETMVGTVTVNGVNADGATIQSVKTFNTAVPETQTTSEAFALLTSIVTDSTPNIGNTSQYQVGWNDILGLPNYPFGATTDVFKIKKNNADWDSRNWSVNATYGIVNMGVLAGITSGDDFTIFYRPYR